MKRASWNETEIEIYQRVNLYQDWIAGVLIIAPPYVSYQDELRYRSL